MEVTEPEFTWNGYAAVPTNPAKTNGTVAELPLPKSVAPVPNAVFLGQRPLGAYVIDIWEVPDMEDEGKWVPKDWGGVISVRRGCEPMCLVHELLHAIDHYWHIFAEDPADETAVRIIEMAMMQFGLKVSL
jgi:hypothetical protein